MTLNYKWVQRQSQDLIGESLYLNNIRIANYNFNEMFPKGHPDAESMRWRGQILLPSIRNRFVIGASEEEIKTTIEQGVTAWFESALREAE